LKIFLNYIKIVPNLSFFTMPQPTPLTLWFNQNRTRYFLIPDDLELTTGDYTLIRRLNETKQVWESDLAPYAITQEAARKHLDDEAAQALSQAKDSVITFLQGFQVPVAPQAEPDPLPASLEKIAQGIEDIALALSERLRAKATDLRTENK
jgi:hypothetical protein